MNNMVFSFVFLFSYVFDVIQLQDLVHLALA